MELDLRHLPPPEEGDATLEEEFLKMLTDLEAQGAAMEEEGMSCGLSLPRVPLPSPQFLMIYRREE
jgi:hypothetical protein